MTVAVAVRLAASRCRSPWLGGWCGRTGLAAVRRCATLPPEVPSFSVDEFRDSVAGGASALERGQMGAGVDEMRTFWRGRGAHSHLSEELAQLATSSGGVWADPSTLSARLEELMRLFAPASLEQLVGKCPQALQMRSETIHQKVSALSEALRGVDILEMIGRHPPLLRRSSETLISRAQVVLTALPRDDMARVILHDPRLLDVSPHEIEARAASIRTSYVPETISGWDRPRAARMMMSSSRRLQRLAQVDEHSPGLRRHVSDETLVNMREDAFQHRFLLRRQRRRKSALGSRGLAPRGRSAESPFIHRESVPRSGSALQFGRMVAEQRERDQLTLSTGHARQQLGRPRRGPQGDSV